MEGWEGCVRVKKSSGRYVFGKDTYLAASEYEDRGRSEVLRRGRRGNKGRSAVLGVG